MTQPEIFVTGAAGTIGQHVVSRLAEGNNTIRAGVHTLTKGERLESPSVEVVEIEYTRPDTLRSAFQGIKKVFLVTPLTPQMVTHTESIVDAATEAGVEQIVKISGFATHLLENEGIEDMAGRWHREAELYIEDNGLIYTHLRPPGFMQNFAGDEAIKRQDTFYNLLGDAKANRVDARDIAAVATAVLTESGHENETYLVTGPESLSNQQIADVLSRVTGREITYANPSEETFRAYLEKRGTDPEIIEARIEIQKIFSEGYGDVVSPVVEQVTKREGTTFEQFAEDYATSFE